MSVGVENILNIDMSVLAVAVFFRPVRCPFFASQANAVTASRKLAVIGATIFAKSAVLADLRAFGACRKAFGADCRTILADIAIVAHEHAVSAVAVAFIAKIGAVLAACAVEAELFAISACTAVVTDNGAQFASVAGRANFYAGTADIAILAPAVSRYAVIALVAVVTEIYTVVADLAAIGTNECALIARIAVFANIDAIAANAAIVAPAVLACASVATSAYQAEILTVAANIAAFGAKIGALRASVAVRADDGTIATGVAILTPAVVGYAIVAFSAIRAEFRAVVAHFLALGTECRAFFTTVLVIAQHRTFSAGVAVFAPTAF